MIDRMHALGIGEGAGRLIDDEAAILPTVPELARDIDQLDEPERRLLVIRRQIRPLDSCSELAATLEASDPAGAAAGQMIERREHAGNVKGLGHIRRPVAGEADALGGADQQTKQRQ